MHRSATLALLLWGGLARAQTPTVRAADLGPGKGPRILAGALAHPYVVVPPGVGEAMLPRDSTYAATVLVLGRTAVVEGTVHGDIIVVGGDLHLHPRAIVSGRAIAIGGGVYESTMSRVGGGTLAFRDFTYDVTTGADGYDLRYRSLLDQPRTLLTWPGAYGLRVPTYDRASGLSVPVAPAIAPGTRLRIEPRITYRSQLGEIDPSGEIRYRLNSRTALTASGGRATFTNDAWIWPDLVNSLATLAAGHDTRNYYRATRFDAAVSRSAEWGDGTMGGYFGGRWERAESVRPGPEVNGGPWTIIGRHDRDDILRPNPAVDRSTIISGLLGASLEQETQGIVARARVDVEGGGVALADAGDNAFLQSTLDGVITFPTFGAQSLRFHGHAVATASGSIAADKVTVPALGATGQGAPLLVRETKTPRQRFVYVGGAGSVPSLGLLERGGDQLIYLDSRYNFPLTAVPLPFGAFPVLSLREVLGGADIRRWPTLAQATGVRLSVSVAYVEFLVDPDRRTSHFGVGLSTAR